MVSGMVNEVIFSIVFSCFINVKSESLKKINLINPNKVAKNKINIICLLCATECKIY